MRAACAQAKVLDRRERLQGLDLHAVLGDSVEEMIANIEELRRFLKIKVEDENDLRMAEQTICELRAFFDRLQAAATERGQSAFELLMDVRRDM